MVSDQTEQRLKNLCAQAIQTNDIHDVERILADFRAALEEHIRHAKVSLASTAYLINDQDPQPAPSPPRAE